jgi:hypothetical protein
VAPRIVIDSYAINCFGSAPPGARDLGSKERKLNIFETFPPRSRRRRQPRLIKRGWVSSHAWSSARTIRYLRENQAAAYNYACRKRREGRFRSRPRARIRSKLRGTYVPAWRYNWSTVVEYSADSPTGRAAPDRARPARTNELTGFSTQRSDRPSPAGAGFFLIRGEVIHGTTAGVHPTASRTGSYG